MIPPPGSDNSLLNAGSSPSEAIRVDDTEATGWKLRRIGR